MKETLKFANYSEIFKLLIEGEEDAIDIYNTLLGKSQNHELRKTFLQFVRDEMNHINNLKNLQEEYPGENFSRLIEVRVNKVKDEPYDLKGLTYTEILNFAIEEEKKSTKLYQDIADQVKDSKVKQLFLENAEEEENHRLHIEKILSLKNDSPR